MSTLYKFLNEDGSPCNGGNGKWHLPQGKRPGKWMPKVNVDPCSSGYHLCREKDLIHWSGPALYLAEGRGASEVCEEKVVYAQARLLGRVEAWSWKIWSLWSADCAERSLTNFEKQFPEDKRPREAIKAVRDYVNECITIGELQAAAWAAESAARSAWSAASAAWSAESAESAARSARSAARSARSAARSAESAESAAWAAESAARSARKWQTKRLLWYLRGGAS